MRKPIIPVAVLLLLIFGPVVNAVTPVQDPANGETNLYLVINQMMGTSFTGSQDSALTALEVEGDDWWHEWDGYISIVATFAGYDQNLWWENNSYSGDIFLASLDGLHFYEDNPITFQTQGGDFYFKNITSGGTWYSREDLNSDVLKHMITYSFGNGIFICALEDVTGLGDQDYNDLVFKIVYGTSPVNIPAVSYISDQAVTRGNPFPTINLDDFVRDDDHGDAAIMWTTSSTSYVSVSIDVNRVATITYPPDSVGVETVVFTATDPDLFFDSEEVTFKVLPPDAPVVVDIPDQTVDSGEEVNPMHLDNYVSHPAPDIGPEDMTWTTSGGDKFRVSIDSQRVATVTYPNGWTGSETITFTATVNPSDSDNVTFTVLSSASGGGGGITVGGVVVPVNKFALVAPWLGLIALMIGIIACAVMRKQKRRPTRS